MLKKQEKENAILALKLFAYRRQYNLFLPKAIKDLYNE